MKTRFAAEQGATSPADNKEAASAHANRNAFASRAVFNVKDIV